LDRHYGSRPHYSDDDGVDDEGEAEGDDEVVDPPVDCADNSDRRLATPGIPAARPNTTNRAIST
jgi:hypothetical protein